jgi:uncharacterized glyoxalase superfamily protein PhnB
MTAPGPIGTLHPFLRYSDPRAAVAWLGRAFGFEPIAIYESPDGNIAHAELRLGDGIIMLGALKEDELNLRTPRQLGAGTQGVYVVLDDVATHCSRAMAAGAEMVRPLATTDYGSIEYCARDPEGHLWSFGTYRPVVAPIAS